MAATTQHAPDRARFGRHAHLSRLGAGLMSVGAAAALHTLWGVRVDEPLLVVGAAGLLWALLARRAAGTLAGTVLLSVALFALLDDHGVFTGLEDALTLLALAAAVVLAHGLPVLRRDVWPIVPAGALVLVAAFVVVRLAAAWIGVPWALVVTLLVMLCGLALLLWDARGGDAP